MEKTKVDLPEGRFFISSSPKFSDYYTGLEIFNLRMEGVIKVNNFLVSGGCVRIRTHI